DVLAHYPGLQTDVVTFLGDRIGETIAGETAQIVINVFCDDLDVADAKARQIAGILSGVPGAADVEVKTSTGAPRIGVRLKSDRRKQFGFRPLDVLEAIATAWQGAIVGQIYQGNRVFDVDVVLNPALRSSITDVGDFLTQNAEGLRVPLSQLADVFPTTGRYSISHEGARRRQTVTCNARGRDVKSVVEEAQQKIRAQVALPKGAYIVYSGAAEQQAKAQHELIFHSIVAGVGIVLLLAILFGNARNLLL